MIKPKKYMSTQEAADLVGCSKNNIINQVKRGVIESRQKAWGERKVYRLRRTSVKKYIDDNDGNNRLGRELFCRPYSRKPIISKGYVMRYIPSHPRATADGYVPEHVLVMEGYLGRKLKKKEVVHHIDRVRDNNDISNLLLFRSRSCHMKLHSDLKKAFLQAQGNLKLEKKIIALVNKYVN